MAISKLFARVEMSSIVNLNLQTKRPVEIRPPSKPVVKPPPPVIKPPPPPKGLLRCLLIGINYVDIPVIQLYGCINDILNTQSHLRKYYPKCNQYKILTDMTAVKPTRANILASIDWLVRGLVPGQNVYFHYSGHGGKVRDTNGDEITGEDSCIIPYDRFRTECITDDELRAALVEKIPPGCKCFAVLDSCHSGSAMDLRYMWQCPSFGKLSFTQDEHYPKSRGKVIFLSGCRDDQYAMDTVNEKGIPTGALTNALLYTWNTYKVGIKVKHLLWDVRKYLKDNGYEQIPQLSSSISISSEESLDLNMV